MLYNIVYIHNLAMTTDTQDTLFPMRELVTRTGVNASTLRAWENRHGLIKPLRTPSGHRLYSPADVRRIRRLQELLAQGLGLADIAPLLDAESAPDLSAGHQPRAAAGGWQALIGESLRAVEDFSSERLDRQYSEACAIHPIELVTAQLIIPMLELLGQRWNQRPSGIAEEHFYSAWLRNKLGARLHHYGPPAEQGSLLILACLPDENHEIGLLLFALAALRQGHRIIYLGANMPIRQIAQVCPHCRPQAIVLAGREAPDARSVIDDIAWLVQYGPAPVMVGSHFSNNQQAALEAVGAVALGNHLDLGLRLLERELRGKARRVRPPAGP
jgi:DNA-binding transcriptional MerR regulator